MRRSYKIIAFILAGFISLLLAVAFIPPHTTIPQGKGGVIVSGAAFVDAYPIVDVFHVKGSINGIPVEMAVDTGASYLTIPKSLAREAGISCLKRITAETSGGEAKFCFGHAERVLIGGLLLPNVWVVIKPVENGTVLLGQSALSRLRIVQENRAMRVSVSASNIGEVTFNTHKE
jgi:aspartyl protease family protein